VGEALRRWKILAPIVHRYYDLNKEGRKQALIAARNSPRSAAQSYEAIVASLRAFSWEARK
jgi:hypothetical protein